MRNESIACFLGKLLRSFFVYAWIGVLTNALGYVLYLILTKLWGAPKLTMTALYFVGALIGFFTNRRCTFRHDGSVSNTWVRYLLAQVLGYLLNLLIMLMFVDWLAFPHQAVQAIAIVLVAIFLFILLRFFVFKQDIPIIRVG